MDEQERIARLEAVVARQQAVIEGLLSDRTEDDGGGRGPTAVGRPQPAPPTAVSRRDVLRRALVAGGVAVAGGAALALAEAAPAVAATGGSLTLGMQNNAESTTVLFADAVPSGDVFPRGLLHVTDTPFIDQLALESSSAISGYASTGDLAVGVLGFGVSKGVWGQVGPGTGTGVVGQGYNGVSGLGSGGTGVAGVAQGTDNTNPGVSASSEGPGPALYAGASTTGDAFVADGASRFHGVTSFSRSGVARVAGTRARPARSVVVKGVKLTAHSSVLATIQQDGGTLGVAGVVPDVAHSAFTITLTARSARNVKVAWFVIG